MADAVEAARARIDRALNDLERKVREAKARPAPVADDDPPAAEDVQPREPGARGRR